MANRGGYKKGELRLTLTEPDQDDPDTYDDEYGFPPNAHMVSGYPVAWLPHSCDQWVIGGRPEVEQLIKDALEVLRAMDVRECAVCGNPLAWEKPPQAGGPVTSCGMCGAGDAWSHHLMGQSKDGKQVHLCIAGPCRPLC